MAATQMCFKTIEVFESLPTLSLPLSTRHNKQYVRRPTFLRDPKGLARILHRTPVQDLFDPRIVDLKIANSHVFWNIFQNLFRNDVILRALGIYEYLKIIGLPSIVTSPANEGSQHREKNLA
ncbi:hypothetical protein N7468_002933 [Penicillium chermesinum]|uniref:Uncharacterized protein n=1 Tax=Penicillium chermesinum TaxID=63820 RepID=A0A9W9TSV3_9EURO|nr:uncharacterized protein N7468_002933 [Penicillium chermesinum]KAJ5238314.1 hypothetical protein N7468_002933 [Penicillium chermesinum]KAJ6163981.1 hypothetical protein N7470_002653 [Penicillium chermesinum]